MKDTVSARDYIRRETVICIGLNIAIGLVIFLLMFGNIDPVPIWGMGQFAFDFLIQAFMIALMSTLIPGLAAAKKVRAGVIALYPGSSSLPKAPVQRALLLAIGAVILVGCPVMTFFWLSNLGTLDWTAALIMKILACAMIAAIVTPIGLRAALNETGAGNQRVAVHESEHHS